MTNISDSRNVNSAALGRSIGGPQQIVPYTFAILSAPQQRGVSIIVVGRQQRLQQDLDTLADQVLRDILGAIMLPQQQR